MIEGVSDAGLIWAALGLPVLGALGIAATGRAPNLREGVTILTALATFTVVVLTLLPKVLAGARPATEPIEVFGGIELAFAIEPLGMLFGTVASTLWIVNSIYSIGYMRGNNEPRQTPFYVCFAIAISAALGIAFAGNLFTLFLFYEILTISTYPLVTHKANDDAKKSGRVYIVLLMATSMMLLLPAIIWTQVAAGTVTFMQGGILAGAGLSTGALGVMLALYIFGIGKAAVMPVHFWLPAAMVAPTPVSALLHAVAVVKAGVFTVVKVIVYIFGVDFLAQSGAADWLTYVAGFTVICASVIALMQDNLKKRLAFSTISQLSYVVLAAAMLTPLALIGATMHIAAHAVSKITLFFAAGSIYTAAHLTEISQLNGIGRRMPWTMGAFTIGALSMIGLPPTAGFLSKWFMLGGAWQGENWVALIVIMVSTCLNAGYFLPIIYRAFWLSPPEDDREFPAHGEGPLPVVLALTLTAAGTIALFLFPDIPFQLATDMMEAPR
ncbi:monovalent cation/H+ antiporter subunit D family protein [Rhodobacteraceae bacterium NNCM2]|nr:monovalent cation/H+ antiporter subunit D family protein [Coraliihabitans acroporae]